MAKEKKLGLLPKLLIGIVLGAVIGLFAPEVIGRIVKTFTGIFGNYLGFIVPLIIIGFVVRGIADISSGAGKLLSFLSFYHIFPQYYGVF